MTPRVLVDATAIPPDRGGVGRYLEGLIGGLALLGADLVVAAKRADADRFAMLAPAARIEIGPAAIARRPARLAWEQVVLPGIARRRAVDVVHSPHYTVPVFVDGPLVVTVHDLTWFSDPELHVRGRRSVFRVATRVAARRATRLVVPSAATRDQLVTRVGADPARVDVVHHGVDLDHFRPPSSADVERVAKALDVEGGYVAFLGTLEPRKNVPALIAGWRRAVEDRADPPALVLAGAKGWDDAVEQAVAAVAPPLRIVRAGYLPIEDLPGFLGGALVVAYPSLGEGFGLPVLEAMACGAAVLTTKRLSLPEVGGDAVAYTEPGADGIAAALARLLDNPDERAALAHRARARATTFTWERCAAEHVVTYERAAREGRRR